MTRRFAAAAHYFVLVLVAAAAATSAGCNLGDLTGLYRGPRPSTVGLTNEAVLVRSITAQSGGSARLILDRVRYIDAGDPHNIDRVIQAVLPQGGPANLQTNDRVLISTTFIEIRDVGDLEEVPDWPGHKYPEYPLGFHQVTAIQRTTP